jgi:hypothetical protein
MLSSSSISSRSHAVDRYRHAYGYWWSESTRVFRQQPPVLFQHPSFSCSRPCPAPILSHLCRRQGVVKPPSELLSHLTDLLQSPLSSIHDNCASAKCSLNRVLLIASLEHSACINELLRRKSFQRSRALYFHSRSACATVRGRLSISSHS